MAIRRIGDWKFDELINAFEQLSDKAAKNIGQIAVNHFKEGFNKEGGQTDNSANGWAKRKQPDTKGKGRKVLTLSGDLKKSIYVKSANKDRIIIATKGIDYAAKHNYGRGRLPQREFIGHSKKLNEKIIRFITKFVDKLLKKV